MRLVPFYSGLAAALLILLVSNQPASAASTELAPGESFTETVHVSVGEDINCTWMAMYASPNYGSAAIEFTVYDAFGAEMMSYTSSSLSRTIFTDTPGDYDLVWTNTQNSAVTLTYWVNSIPGLEEVDEWVDAALLAAIIGIVIVVAVVIIVIVVVLSSERRHRAQVPPSAQYAGPVYQQPVALAGKCPMCGREVEPQGAFCSYCGARVR